MNNDEVIQALDTGKNVMQNMKVNMEILMGVVRQAKDLDIENADIKESLDTITEDIKSKVSDLIDEIDAVIY